MVFPQCLAVKRFCARLSVATAGDLNKRRGTAMKKIHKIIVPIDFLQHTDQLVDYARYIAKKFDATLYFIHVVEDAHLYGDYDFPPPSMVLFNTEVVKMAEEKMKQLVDKNRHICPGTEGKICRGDKVDSIIDYTEDKGGDLIIIGTHGRKGFEKMWLGSIAERVIKRASCPTLTCNPYDAII